MTLRVLEAAEALVGGGCHLREEGEVDKEGMKRAIKELLVGTSALDEGFHGPEVFMQLLIEDLEKKRT